MFESYAIGMIVIVAVSVAWVGVQSAWGRSFPREGTDPDVLAGRLGCGGCDSTEQCDRPCPERATSAEEDLR